MVGRMNLAMLLFSCVILWMRAEETKSHRLVGARNRALILGTRRWPTSVSRNLHLKLEMVCRFCSSMFVFMLWMKAVSSALKLCILTPGTLVSVACVSLTWLLSGIVGFPDGSLVTVMTRCLKSGVVCVVRLMRLPATGLKALGQTVMCGPGVGLAPSTCSSSELA